MTRLKDILIGPNPRRTIIRASIIAMTSALLFGFIIRPVIVKGISMAPTLEDGTIHFVNLVAYLTGEPKRGDMVAVAMPGRKAYYMKRVLGLPGETIAFDQGVLVINSQPVNEPYLTELGNWNLAKAAIPEGSYFIAGDNRRTRFNSHTLGFVDRNDIVGKLIHIRFYRKSPVDIKP